MPSDLEQSHVAHPTVGWIVEVLEALCRAVDNRGLERVRAEGRPYTPARRQRGERKRSAKSCYLATLRHTSRHPELTYVEGYAARPGAGPILHAWAADDAGRVIDLTWDTPEECSYFGIPMSPLELLGALKRNAGQSGVLAGEPWRAPDSLSHPR